jgi:hypothetical protein
MKRSLLFKILHIIKNTCATTDPLLDVNEVDITRMRSQNTEWRIILVVNRPQYSINKLSKWIGGTGGESNWKPNYEAGVKRDVEDARKTQQNSGRNKSLICDVVADDLYEILPISLCCTRPSGSKTRQPDMITSSPNMQPAFLMPEKKLFVSSLQNPPHKSVMNSRLDIMVFISWCWSKIVGS